LAGAHSQFIVAVNEQRLIMYIVDVFYVLMLVLTFASRDNIMQATIPYIIDRSMAKGASVGRAKLLFYLILLNILFFHQQRHRRQLSIIQASFYEATLDGSLSHSAPRFHLDGLYILYMSAVSIRTARLQTITSIVFISLSW